MSATMRFYDFYCQALQGSLFPSKYMFFPSSWALSLKLACQLWIKGGPSVSWESQMFFKRESLSSCQSLFLDKIESLCKLCLCNASLITFLLLVWQVEELDLSLANRCSDWLLCKLRSSASLFQAFSISFSLCFMFLYIQLQGVCEILSRFLLVRPLCSFLG